MSRAICLQLLVVLLGGCRPPAPPDGRLRGLAAPAELVVDDAGWPHVRASTLRDAGLVEGYAMARNRLPQMELLRRTASGTLAELFGAISERFLQSDVTMRTIGLRRSAEAVWAATPPGRARDLLAGYADGVNARLDELRRGAVPVPRGAEVLLTSATRDWSPVDSLTVLRLMELFLCYNADEEINRTLLRERARAVFDDADAAVAPERAARRGLFVDLVRFAPPSTASIVPDYYQGARRTVPLSPRRHAARLAPEQLRALAALRDVLPASGRREVGTNAWAVAGVASASGNALLANDPHLPLLAPSILWGVHIQITGGDDATDVVGTSFPGVPGVVFGASSRVAWGLANCMFDLMDVYDETVQGGAVEFAGGLVPLETRVEKVGNGLFGTVDVTIETVPHHGPILPVFSAAGLPTRRTGSHALSVRWTAAGVSHEIEALTELMYAADTPAAAAVARAVDVPSIAFVFADTHGQVAYRATGGVPIRAPGALTFDPEHAPDGTMPAAVLPGGGEAEWIGTVDADALPQATAGPSRPWLVASNNNPASLSADGNPFDATPYLGYGWAPGFRGERVAQRLKALGPSVTRADMEAIQADHVVLVAGRLRPFLHAALARFEHAWSEPGSEPELAASATAFAPRRDLLRQVGARLDAWSLDAAADGDDGVAAAAFHAWLAALLDGTLGDEMAALAEPAPAPLLPPDAAMTAVLALLEHPERARTGEALWDNLRTPEHETRDVVLVRALGQAIDTLTAQSGSADPAGWRWGALHTIRFQSALPHFSLSLFTDLSIPAPGDARFPGGFARPGGVDTVDQAWPELVDAAGHYAPVFTYSRGPARRLTLEMTPEGPRAWDALPGGESGDLTSPHFADEAELWRANRTHALPLTAGEIAAHTELRLLFEPPN